VSSGPPTLLEKTRKNRPDVSQWYCEKTTHGTLGGQGPRFHSSAALGRCNECRESTDGQRAWKSKELGGHATALAHGVDPRTNNRSRPPNMLARARFPFKAPIYDSVVCDLGARSRLGNDPGWQHRAGPLGYGAWLDLSSSTIPELDLIYYGTGNASTIIPERG